VDGVLATWLSALSDGPHHRDVLQPVLKLLRLRQQGHVGVAAALVQAEDAFVRAMATRRSEVQAREEFQRSIQGARRGHDSSGRAEAACSLRL